MNTTENNKLIADFMGIKYVYDDKYIENIKEMRVNGVMFEQGYMLSELKYNTDWNWLMPVVREIYNTELPNEDNNYIGDITEALLDVDIQSLHKAVIEFIKWYNLNKLN